jgi:SAM-dependent methyltransferase
MHPIVYAEFEKICARRNARGSVLEVGALPTSSSLLNMKLLEKATEKIGINLEGPAKYNDFCIIKGNANDMSCFENSRFDTVLCNAVLEHDKYFWKTVSEIKRVAKPGGLIVIGTPGYTRFGVLERIEKMFSKIPFMSRHADFLCSTTVTFKVHDDPGDYYRFSPQAFRSVFFDGMKEVEIRSVMVPPRIIGSGIKP